jgi:hypothetical protein
MSTDDPLQAPHARGRQVLPVDPSEDELARHWGLTPADLARVSPLPHAHTVPSGSYFQSPRRRTGLAPEPVMA